jgi:hypothetical protein
MNRFFPRKNVEEFSNAQEGKKVLMQSRGEEKMMPNRGEESSGIK